MGRVRFHLAAENTVTGETACMTLPEGESAVSGRLCGWPERRGCPSGRWLISCS